MNLNQYQSNYFITLSFIVFILSSSLVFTYVTSTQKFDERYHIVDIHRYANEGINLKTILLQTTPTGPGTHFWSGMWGKVFGESLQALRLSTWFCWVFIAFIYLILFYNHGNDKILFSCLFLFINPYTATLSGLIMTEPFALFCLIIGLYYLIKLSSNSEKYIYALLGSALMGIAVISRLYFLCVVPTVVICITYIYRKQLKAMKLVIVISLLLMIMPISVLYYIWDGITPPLYSKGDVFKNQNIHLGINLPRIVSVIMYIGIYSVPFIFILNLKYYYRNWLLWIVSIILGFIVYIKMYIWALDPVYYKTGLVEASISFFMKKNNFMGNILYFLSCVIAILGIQILIYKTFKMMSASIDIVTLFAATMIFFFVMQQLFVSGHNPFYDRYLIHIIPFVGLLLYNNNNKFNWQIISLALVYMLVGQVLLWRWFFV